MASDHEYQLHSVNGKPKDRNNEAMVYSWFWDSLQKVKWKRSIRFDPLWP